MRRICGAPQAERILPQFHCKDIVDGPGVRRAECLRHHFPRDDTVLLHEFYETDPVSPVLHRLPQQELHCPVCERLLPECNDCLKEQVGLFKLVVEEKVVLRELNLPGVQFPRGDGPERVERGEHPAPPARFLVCDFLVLEAVGKMRVDAGRHLPARGDLPPLCLGEGVLYGPEACVDEAGFLEILK